MTNCLFCKIARKEIPSNIVFETETVIAFEDISSQAPVHILVIPKKHISNLLGFDEINATLLPDIFSVLRTIAVDNQLDLSGFRVVTNTGEHGGQTVDHVHFHLLGGRQLNWPPG